MDPATMAIIANRLDGIVREMTATLMRAARSAVIAVARDFSCSIVTSDDRLLAAAEGLPVHIFGTHLQTAEMRRLHPGFREGDAFLDNDPYVGNTHHADHTILVPVFVDGEHFFTAAAKAHQADLGNSQPTQFMAFARDLYEEGALNFPCVQVQRDYENLDDIVRMCRRRIRVPDQWYGDYLATVGAARIAERRLKELVAKYGGDQIRQFVEEWFDYSERRIAHAISTVPSGTYTWDGQHDSFGPAPAIPIAAEVKVDAEACQVEVDLRENPDCVEAGLNLSQATATNSAIAGIFFNLDPEIPHNAGSFRRIAVHLRENCVVGVPSHPTCCSVATTNVADRLVNIVSAAFAGAGGDRGVAEGGTGLAVGYSVISGRDWRTDAPYVNQILIGNNGGPASASEDGWLTWTIPVTAGLLYRDSVEIDEQKYPIHVASVRLVEDSGGVGKFRGGLAAEVAFGTRGQTMRVIWAGDGHESPARGVHGGGAGSLQRSKLVDADGSRTTLPGLGDVELEPGQLLIGVGCGGGGFGRPWERDVEKVLADVRDGWVSRAAAREAYGVAVVGDEHEGTLRVDPQKTAHLRTEIAEQSGPRTGLANG